MLRSIRGRYDASRTLGMAIGNPIVLSVRSLTKTYRSAGEDVVVLRGVNLDIAAGERVALTGESGSGKSTLLHLIAGLDRPDGGEDQAGRYFDFRSHRRRPGGIAARPAGAGVSTIQPDPKPEHRRQPRVPVAHRRASRCGVARRTGGAARARRFAQALSRTIVRRPAAAGRNRPRAGGKTALLLADEPTGNLDEATADDVLALTRDLVERTGCGFLMVTHSARLAATLDRQINLHAGLIA